jgi:hypothetical protein
MVGVEGGEALLEMDEAMSLKEMDPERYGSLVHPGDGYSFDIFTQVAQALRRAARSSAVRGPASSSPPANPSPPSP